MIMLEFKLPNQDEKNLISDFDIAKAETEYCADSVLIAAHVAFTKLREKHFNRISYNETTQNGSLVHS